MKINIYNLLISLTGIVIILCLFRLIFIIIKSIIIKRSNNLENFNFVGKNYRENISFKELVLNFFVRKKNLSILLMMLILFIVFLIFFKDVYLCIFLTVASFLIIYELIQNIVSKRKEQFEIQLVEFLSNMIILLRSGKNIRQVFFESLTWAKDPLRKYIKEFLNEIEFNVPFEVALDNFAKNTGVNEITLLANAIKINNKIGGNLIFIVSNVLETLQKNLQLRTKIKTRTAQSRFSGNIIILFPVIGFIFMYLFFYEYVIKFTSSSFGSISLFIGAVLELLGYLAIKRIVKEDYI